MQRDNRLFRVFVPILNRVKIVRSADFKPINGNRDGLKPADENNLSRFSVLVDGLPRQEEFESLNEERDDDESRPTDQIMHAADIDSAYLYGGIARDVYMEQPTIILESSHNRDKICKMHKSIQVVKQAGNIWSSVSHNHLISLGLRDQILSTEIICSRRIIPSLLSLSL